MNEHRGTEKQSTQIRPNLALTFVTAEVVDFDPAEYVRDLSDSTDIDSDGQKTFLNMSRTDRSGTIVVSIRRGVQPTMVAAKLRKFAELIDRYGLEWLNLPENHRGGGILTADDSVAWWEDGFGDSLGCVSER